MVGKVKSWRLLPLQRVKWRSIKFHFRTKAQFLQSDTAFPQHRNGSFLLKQQTVDASERQVYLKVNRGQIEACGSIGETLTAGLNAQIGSAVVQIVI